MKKIIPFLLCNLLLCILVNAQTTNSTTVSKQKVSSGGVLRCDNCGWDCGDAACMDEHLKSCKENSKKAQVVGPKKEVTRPNLQPSQPRSLRGSSFTEPKDFVLNNPLLMKELGYESLTIKAGTYQIDKGGNITLNIASAGNSTSPVSDRIINPTDNPIKQYRGVDCERFGFSCCVYGKDKTNELVSYQFVITRGKPVQLKISFRGSGSPRQAGF
ncbi:MAG: hypothetical protein ACOVMM_13355 [Chitinophagaceae bacterium]